MDNLSKNKSIEKELRVVKLRFYLKRINKTIYKKLTWALKKAKTLDK